MTDEKTAKNSTLAQAEKFISGLKRLIDEIEVKLSGTDEFEQMAATINAIAMNECMNEHYAKCEEIEKMLKNRGILN